MKQSERIDRNQCIITSLDEMIDENSNVRVIDAYVRSLDVEKLGYHIYTNKVGRPAYNPQELIGLYLYSYMSKVMSSRMMEQQTYINIEIMWLLNGSHPDHSTIAAFRSKNAEALTNTFRDFTGICMDLKLIGGRILAVDGTKLHASNNKKRNYSERTLKKKIEHIDSQIEEYLTALDENDKLSEKTHSLTKRKEMYQNLLKRLEETEETQISTTDKDSRLMDNKKGGLDVGYNIQATVDSKNGLVVDQYVTNDATDQGELAKVAERAQDILSKKKIAILADKGYYNGEDIDKCFSNGAVPLVSRQNPPVRDGMYSIEEFVYNEEKDSFVCPQGNELQIISGEDSDRIVYANKSACRICPHKAECFKQGGKRKYRRVIKDKFFKKTYKADNLFKKHTKLYHKRQELSEPVFGSIKRTLGFPMLNVRTKRKVEGEVSLLFLGYNLKRVINLIGKTKLIAYFRERNTYIGGCFSKYIVSLLIICRISKAPTLCI